jgi:CHAD domain-containing protein
MRHTPWVHYQEAILASLCRSLKAKLRGLHDNPTEKRVHDARVALRRWFSVWGALGDDGRISKKFQRRVVKRLRKILKCLGRLRDWDVNLSLGTTLGLRQSILDDWMRQQKSVRRDVLKEIKRLDPDKLVSRLERHLAKQSKAPRSKSTESAFDTLDIAVTKQEAQVKKLEENATTPEDLHRLRLGIKRWRYLMSEFFTLANLELTEAQRLLGEMHDYQRLETMTSEIAAPEAREKLIAAQASLMERLGKIRKSLPYGMRPILVGS